MLHLRKAERRKAVHQWQMVQGAFYCVQCDERSQLLLELGFMAMATTSAFMTESF